MMISNQIWILILSFFLRCEKKVQNTECENWLESIEIKMQNKFSDKVLNILW